jgi:hypothetical protein
MTLDSKSLVELEQIAEGLRRTIERNPNHSRIEQVELQDVEQWIRERKSQAKSEPDDIVF